MKYPLNFSHCLRFMCVLSRALLRFSKFPWDKFNHYFGKIMAFNFFLCKCWVLKYRNFAEYPKRHYVAADSLSLNAQQSGFPRVKASSWTIIRGKLSSTTVIECWRIVEELVVEHLTNHFSWVREGNTSVGCTLTH